MKPQGDSAAFVHQASIYGSDDELLAMAVPFIEDGLARDEPVLVTTTSANLALLGAALGAGWEGVDYAESAYFGRRAAERVAAFDRYWTRNATSTRGNVRILAEPVWSGRSDREVAAWTRMESSLNVVLAGTRIWMICPYDARVAPPAVVADARRTHPMSAEGRQVRPCPEFVDPAAFTRSFDTGPLPDPPPWAATLRLDGAPSLFNLRRFVAAGAAEHGLARDRAQMLVAAVSEAASYLAAGGSGGTVASIWTELGSIVCDLHQPGGRIDDPFLGLRPPGDSLAPDAGLWFARQVCDAVEIRSGDDGCAVRVWVPGARAEELLQSTASSQG